MHGYGKWKTERLVRRPEHRPQSRGLGTKSSTAPRRVGCRTVHWELVTDCFRGAASGPHVTTLRRSLRAWCSGLPCSGGFQLDNHRPAPPLRPPSPLSNPTSWAVTHRSGLSPQYQIQPSGRPLHHPATPSGKIGFLREAWWTEDSGCHAPEQ